MSIKNQILSTLSHLAQQNGSYVYVSTSEWAQECGINRRRGFLPIVAALCTEGKIRLSKGRKARVVGGTIDMHSQRGLRIKVLEPDTTGKPLSGILASTYGTYSRPPQGHSKEGAQSKSRMERAQPDKNISKTITSNNNVITNNVIWRGSKKQEPRRLERLEQLYWNADQVTADELRTLEQVIGQVYMSTFSYKWYGLRRRPDITASKRIIALTRMRDWDAQDFLEVNFIWFRDRAKRRPVVSNVSGEKAEERYESWLVAERYTNGEGQANGSRRKRELICLRCKKERTESKRTAKRLYWQMMKWLDGYLARYANILRQSVRQRKMRLKKPAWLLVSEEDQRTYWIQKQLALKKLSIVRRWWLRELQGNSLPGDGGCSDCKRR